MPTPSNGQYHEPEPTPDAIVAAGVVIPEHALTLKRDPVQVIAEAKRAADALIRQIDADSDKIVINGEIYPKFEDWQMLGRFFNVSAAVVSTKFVEFGEVVGFEATAETLLLIDDRTVRVGAADGLCLNDEWKWSDKPLFQLKSMAQTRACAKALRIQFGWIVALAGYKPTPAEEMEPERDREQPIVATPRRQSQPKPEREPEGEPERRQERPREFRPRDRRPGQRFSQRYDPYTRPSVNHSRGRGRGPDGQQISDRQLNRLFAIARDNGIPNAEVRRIVNHYGFSDAADITRDCYEDICDCIFKRGER